MESCRGLNITCSPNNAYCMVNCTASLKNNGTSWGTRECYGTTMYPNGANHFELVCDGVGSESESHFDMCKYSVIYGAQLPTQQLDVTCLNGIYV